MNTIANANKTIPAETPIIPVILITRPMKTSLFRISDALIVGSENPDPHFSRTSTQRPFSFDHLVGAGEYSARNFNAQRFRGFQIDDEMTFGWQHHLITTRWVCATLPRLFN
jgi:hypothetical protein